MSEQNKNHEHSIDKKDKNRPTRIRGLAAKAVYSGLMGTVLSWVAPVHMETPDKNPAPASVEFTSTHQGDSEVKIDTQIGTAVVLKPGQEMNQENVPETAVPAEMVQKPQAEVGNVTPDVTSGANMGLIETSTNEYGGTVERYADGTEISARPPVTRQ